MFHTKVHNMIEFQVFWLVIELVITKKKKNFVINSIFVNFTVFIHFLDIFLTVFFLILNIFFQKIVVSFMTSKNYHYLFECLLVINWDDLSLLYTREL